MDELGDIKAVAELLGVSRPRVAQLVDDDPTFPAHVKRFGRMKVWHLPAVAAWANRPDIKSRRNTPGRPPKPKD